MSSKFSVLGRRSTFAAVCALTTVGCHLSDGGLSPYRPPDQYFAVLALEHHAINLSMVAPYDTVTLHTIHEMGDGSVVPGDVVYSVSSPSLSITDGVLKAESPLTRAVVRVTLTYGTITRTDSAIVSVIAAAPNLLRDCGLRVPANDSAKIGAGTAVKTIPLVRESMSGANVPALLVSIVSSDSTVAAVTQSGNNVRVTPKRPGRVMVSTSTYAFGTAWRDSLVFTVGWPTQYRTIIYERFVAGTLTPMLDFSDRGVATIGVGGCVTWLAQSTEMDVDLQFDDPAHAGAPIGNSCSTSILDPTISGNVAPFRTIQWDGDPAHILEVYLSSFRARVFTTPGDYPYRSTLHGTTGVVRVCDERNDTTCAPSGIGGWY